MAAAEKTLVRLTPPVRGIDKNAPFALHRQSTCPAALNARPYDQSGETQVFGPRAGQSKWHASQINGANAVQNIVQIVEAIT